MAWGVGWEENEARTPIIIRDHEHHKKCGFLVMDADARIHYI